MHDDFQACLLLLLLNRLGIIVTTPLVPINFSMFISSPATSVKTFTLLQPGI